MIFKSCVIPENGMYKKGRIYDKKNHINREKDEICFGDLKGVRPLHPIPRIRQ